jgi:hypothetical protein
MEQGSAVSTLQVKKKMMMMIGISLSKNEIKALNHAQDYLFHNSKMIYLLYFFGYFIFSSSSSFFPVSGSTF